MTSNENEVPITKIRCRVCDRLGDNPDLVRFLHYFNIFTIGRFMRFTVDFDDEEIQNLLMKSPVYVCFMKDRLKDFLSFLL